jgi:hypothetical protein
VEDTVVPQPLSKVLVLTAVAVLALAPQNAHADLIVQFDYSFDTNNFFAQQVRRDALEAAADRFEARLQDNLSAITPSGGNTWTSQFFHPGTGANQMIVNPSIAASTIVVYVGGRDLGSLGVGGPGGIAAGSGDQDWINLLLSRGQAGALANPETDFGPWGGSIAFDTNPANPWNFGLGGPVTGQNDFLSVALHELGHVLGVGLADSWLTRVTGGVFTGPASVAAFGGNVPVQAGGGHWANNTMSTFMGMPQEAAMDPDLTVGTRKEFTVLDFAGLTDIGWQVAPTAVPEPSVFLLTSFGMGAVGFWQYRRRGTRPTAA